MSLEDSAAACKQWREVAGQARQLMPKPAALMDDAEADMLAYMERRAKLHSTNRLERLNGETAFSLHGPGNRRATMR